MRSLGEHARAWFQEALFEPTPVQARGWPHIAKGESTLLLAPTGSGKTLAAFLIALDKLLANPRPPREIPKKRGKRAKAEEVPRSIRVLYISPLKALAADIEKNLDAPLAGILSVAERAGVKLQRPTIALRTGDTPAKERARILKDAPDILVTTPESLYLMLTSRARETLREVETVIIDEIHAMVATKRGAHLAVSLERLEALRAKEMPPLQRIGLSATQRPVEIGARMLGGFSRGKPRAVTIVDASGHKALSIEVQVPDLDMAQLGDRDPKEAPAGGATPLASIWPKLHEQLLALIRAHRTTLIFVNARRLAERLAAALNELAGEEIVLAHHGSVAREARLLIEDRLKRGELPALVATSSLELGIDVGAIDLVVQIEAPSSIASGLQRIGRAGHSVGEVSHGVMFPKHRADLLSCAAAAERMRANAVENTAIVKSPLDVLAQQIVATVSVEAMSTDALFDLVRGAAPFVEFPRRAFDDVLDMLSGRYPSDEFRELRARIVWDRVKNRVRAKDGAALLAITNGGTIPDRGLYGVFLPRADGKSTRVGELDEEMVFEMRQGDVFLLGASSWRIQEITLDKVLVVPAAGEPGRMPFWHGDRLGRSVAFGEAIGALTRTLAHESPEKSAAILAEAHSLGPSAIDNAIRFVAEQRAATGEVPSDRAIVVERFTDDMGDHRVCVLSPFGARVHAPWATAVVARMRRERAAEVDVTWSDDGIAFRIGATDSPPDVATFFPRADEVEAEVTQALFGTALFAARFRECAQRALLLPRRSPQMRTPLWRQRKRASDLLAVASQYPAFPIVLETYRECLRDVFDLPGLKDILARTEQRKIRVITADRDKPSPFAASLLFSFVASFLYDGDAPLAERRAQALTLDQDRLRELFGESEMRALLDPKIIEAHERILQRIAFPAKNPDALHDVLLEVGDLTDEEASLRVMDAALAPPWLEELREARRIARAQIGGESRWIALEDAARFRDALGVVPPRGLPLAFSERVPDPLGDIVRRFARTHGPFAIERLAARFGLGVATASEVCARLVSKGVLVEGAFLEHGHGVELCDDRVLTALKQKARARLRREAEPVSAAAYTRFLLAWQGIGAKRRGESALVSAIEQLEAYPIPASILERDVLPSRIEKYSPYDLDRLVTTGEIVWAGVEPIGPGDGRVALYFAEHEEVLAQPIRITEGELAAKIRGHLERRGAVFFPEIARAVGGMPRECAETLWDMIWAGEVVNDTLEALRSYLGARASKEKRRDRVRHRIARSPIAGTEGRFSLRVARWDTTFDGTHRAPSETDKRAALAQTLLGRYGVVTRESAQGEGITGGFGAVYGVLKVMEDAGKLRRGYFIEGQGAAQFAEPGADDRLRAARDETASEQEDARAVVIAAADPANPYGACLPWPAHENPENAGRSQRAAGARVVIANGALLAWIGRGASSLVTYLPDADPQRSQATRALAVALSDLVDEGSLRALHLVTIDGAAPGTSPLASALRKAGFVIGERGALKRKDRALSSFLYEERVETGEEDTELTHDA